MRSILLLLIIAADVGAQTGSVYNAADASGAFIAFPANLPPNFSWVVSPFGTTQSSLAPGSLATIETYSVASGATSATVSIRPAGSSVTIAAQNVNVTNNNISFVVPPTLSPGQVQVIYRIEGDVTNWTTATITPASFSLFRSGSVGPVRAQQIAADGSLVPTGLSTPARAGQAVVLWGSGLGNTPAAKVGVTLGGVSQTVLYAGPSPSVPGVDQINFRVAQGTSEGCYVPLTVTYGQQAVTSFMSTTANGLPCAHPLQLAAADLKILDAGGTIAVGQLIISSDLFVTTPAHAYREEHSSVIVTGGSAQDFAAYLSAQVNKPGCFLPDQLQPSAFAAAFIYGLFPPTVDLGDMITLKNSTVAVVLTPATDQFPPFPFSSLLPTGPDSPLASLPAPVFAGGTWIWSSSGGDLPSDPFPFTLPAPIQINGSAPLTFSRDQDQILTWNGSGLDPAATVTITISTLPVLTCKAPARTGTITIPKTLLSQISPVTATLTARVSQPPTVIPHPALKSGVTLVLVFRPTSSDTRSVDIQ